MANLFWLSDEQWAVIEPFMPRGQPYSDHDRRQKPIIIPKGADATGVLPGGGRGRRDRGGDRRLRHQRGPAGAAVEVAVRAPVGPALALGVSVAVLYHFRHHSRLACAVEEDAINWWIYAGSARSPLTARFFGPEGLTPAAAAAVGAARGFGLVLRAERLATFRETLIGGEPLMFGPWMTRAKVPPRSLAFGGTCLRPSSHIL